MEEGMKQDLVKIYSIGMETFTVEIENNLDFIPFHI